MADRGTEEGCIEAMTMGALDELMHQLQQDGHARWRVVRFLTDVRAIIEASVKAAIKALDRGSEQEDVYQLVLDHLRELPGKLREL